MATDVAEHWWIEEAILSVDRVHGRMEILATTDGSWWRRVAMVERKEDAELIVKAHEAARERTRKRGSGDGGDNDMAPR